MTLEKIKKQVEKWLNIVIMLCGGLSCLWILWIVLQVTTFASFKIPSDSMRPALIPGDYVWVNKWIMGGRVFDVYEAIDGNHVKIRRLPGFGKIKRNDVLVFNYPYPDKKDSISMDIMLYYIKRCVALPGDTFEIRNAMYKVRGYDGPLGNEKAQTRLAELVARNLSRKYGIVMEAYPYNKELNWSIDEFGPLYVPMSGDSVQMNYLNKDLYGRLIEWEQQKKLMFRDGRVYLGDSVVNGYRFQENYYFVVGDNVQNSRDSRYWGLLPESMIVGKATRIWKSVDRITDELRWDRVLKKIDSP